LKTATACLPVNDAPAPDLADLHALQRGDDAALNRLIAQWERRLFGFAWRYVRNTADAQDLVAEVFVRLYQGCARLRTDTNLSAWLFTTLANLCHNHHRWRRRHPTASLEVAEAAGAALAAPAPSPGQSLEQRERLDALAQAIDALSPDLKLTLLLHHYERLSYREIADITGCSENGVDTRLYRAKKQLRETLGA
jgi:RNA polymerase sigma-70 factor (ECF subfamily)